MAHSLEDFDAWKTGENDKNAPFNQKEEEIDDRGVGALLAEQEDEKAIDLLLDIAREVKQLRELCKQTNKDGNKDFLINRLTKIYKKL